MRLCKARRCINRRFTLVEILAVVAILGVLMAIGVGVYSLAMDKAKRSKTEALIKKLEVALEAFKAKYGYYPQNDVGANNYFYLELNNMGQGTWPDTDSKNYFLKTIDAETVLQANVVSGILVDAWGNPIYYCCPGNKNTSSFDIVSAGPDGKIDGKDLWKADMTLNGSADPTKTDTKTSDDIANF